MGVTAASASESQEGAGDEGEGETDVPSPRSLFETLAEAAPPGYMAAHKCPADDVSLLHEQVGFCWEVEGGLRWECGRVVKRLSEGRKRTKGCSQATFIPAANHEVKFFSELHLREVQLTAYRYSAAKATKAGARVWFVKSA